MSTTSTTEPGIRPARPSDAPVLSVLATEVWLDTYAAAGVSPAFAAHLLETYSPAAFDRAIAAPDIALLVAHQGEHVLGYARLALAPHPDGAEIATLYLRRAHRRRGIGARLLAAAEDLAAAAGRPAVWLTVQTLNAPALDFYRAQGFAVTGETVFHFQGLASPNLILSRRLGGTARR